MSRPKVIENQDLHIEPIEQTCKQCLQVKMQQPAFKDKQAKYIYIEPPLLPLAKESGKRWESKRVCPVCASANKLVRSRKNK